MRGDQKAPGLESPVIQSGSETWAPSGTTFFDGSLYFVGLRGQSLYELAIEDEPATFRRHLNKNFGRLRDVVAGPDNRLYLLTSNRDGRGLSTVDDDQIIRVNPKKLGMKTI
ncbi:MAG: PQQ-dependent sugar dehydrogenase [Candidatus Hydrothermarchaeales archaeon]